MATLFSGTDIATLREEGNDNNHFVSLIINNAGKYSAKITRKVTALLEAEIVGNKHVKYNTFDDKVMDTSTPYNEGIKKEATVIEHYPLTIDVEEFNLEKSELERRLDEICKAPTSFVNKPTIPNKNYALGNNLPYMKSATPMAKQESYAIEELFSAKSQPQGKQLELFSEKEMQIEAPHSGDLTKVNIIEDDDDIDVPYDKVHIDSELITSHVRQLITLNIFAGKAQNIDVSQWASNMENTFNFRFKGESGMDQFGYIADSLLEALQMEVDEIHPELINKYGNDAVYAIWAWDLDSALQKYPTNEYITYYVNSLERWLI